MISAEEARLLEPYFAKSEASEITMRQAEKVSVETGICLRKVEWFAIRKGFVPRRYRHNLGTFSCAGPRSQQFTSLTCLRTIGKISSCSFRGCWLERLYVTSVPNISLNLCSSPSVGGSNGLLGLP